MKVVVDAGQRGLLDFVSNLVQTTLVVPAYDLRSRYLLGGLRC